MEGKPTRTKYIFCTGGVVSSVGKGVVAASLGRLLKSRGLSVVIQKLDPYINVDPGTMSPYQHGEVYVLEDGAETDLDLGHYERFIDENLTSASNVTTGQAYQAVIAKERRGDFLGGTIQVVPHITDEIKAMIRRVARKTGAQVVISEVGGTVGDIEGLPFLEAIRQFRVEEGPENVLIVHITFLPYIEATRELKTKPTQHSVKELRGIGIQPDFIICRSDRPVHTPIQEKVALFCDVEPRAVIPLETVPVIYQVPLVLEEAGLGDLILERMRLASGSHDLSEWRKMVEQLLRPKEAVRVAIVGKYVGLPDSYISVREALTHAALHHDRALEILWIHAEDLERGEGWDRLRAADGIVVPGGFDARGIEGKILAARYARENGVPYLGLCLGMQVMIIELARTAMDDERANSSEFDPETPFPVIDLLPEQRDLTEKGATMRLGAIPCQVVAGTRASRAYDLSDGGDGSEGDGLLISERRRHRYEVNNRYREVLEGAGLQVSGTSPDGRLVEIAEIADHSWMVGSQFHPEFKSRPERPHPLFRDFVGAAEANRAARTKDGTKGAG
ncbi:MAG: CTP synthase [Anaerolineae bacterium]